MSAKTDKSLFTPLEQDLEFAKSFATKAKSFAKSKSFVTKPARVGDAKAKTDATVELSERASQADLTPRSQPRSRTESQGTSAVLPRTVSILKRDSSSANVSNATRSAKYSLLSFFPLACYELFHPVHRFANVYFLIVGFVQMVPAISLTEGTPMVWLNLGFVVIQDMLAMAFEDSQRHYTDRTTNNQPTEILSADGGSYFKKSTWSSVRVGDVVRCGHRTATARTQHGHVASASPPRRPRGA